MITLLSIFREENILFSIYLISMQNNIQYDIASRHVLGRRKKQPVYGTTLNSYQTQKKKTVSDRGVWVDLSPPKSV